MRLHVLKRHRFAGVQYGPGDTYEAEGRHARVLIAAKLSMQALSPADSAYEDSSGEYQRSDLTADQGAKPKRKYSRRDMKSEG